MASVPWHLKLDRCPNSRMLLLMGIDSECTNLTSFFHHSDQVKVCYPDHTLLFYQRLRISQTHFYIVIFNQRETSINSEVFQNTTKF